VSARFRIELDDGEHLCAREPSAAQVAKAASQLASFYNDPYNRAMLAHEEALSGRDVVAHYRALAREGARAVLLEIDGRLVGDADLRHLRRDSAEIAILIGDRTLQGKGLGTRFGVMLHALAFGALRLRRVYASIIPANAASLRLFERLGYERDQTPAARRFIEDPDDVVLSLEPERFDSLHGSLAARVRVTGEARPAARRARVPK
jgi:RimJ/RimL family protein N-acetyltransferase